MKMPKEELDKIVEMRAELDRRTMAYENSKGALIDKYFPHKVGDKAVVNTGPQCGKVMTITNTQLSQQGNIVFVIAYGTVSGYLGTTESAYSSYQVEVDNGQNQKS